MRTRSPVAFLKIHTVTLAQCSSIFSDIRVVIISYIPKKIDETSS